MNIPINESDTGPSGVQNDQELCCEICPRHCRLQESRFGLCGARQRRGNVIVPVTYGRLTGAVVDPMEKKPLYHFYPGSKILSIGSFGCNLFCTFCQNWSSSQAREIDRLNPPISPREIVRQTKDTNCIGVAFTYNEPVINAEYVIDVAKECRKAGLKTVAVSNGYISDQWRAPFFEYIDAANIDLKSFTPEFYRKYCFAELEPVKQTLTYLAKKSDCWLEVTTLLIPSLNDSEQELDALSKWIAKELGYQVPVHFSAFRPAYQLQSIPATPPTTLFQAREIALANGLKFVYTGNIDDPAGQTTTCPQCHQAIISRTRFQVDEYHVDEEFCCRYCGQSIAGLFCEEPRATNTF